MSLLTKKIEDIPKINRRIIPPLKHLGIKTLHDLLFHFPSRYEDFSNIKKIKDIFPDERVTVEGKISAIKHFRTRVKGMHIIDAVIEDESSAMHAVWFNQPFLERVLKQGNIFRFSGKATKGQWGTTLQNPSHERISTLANAKQGIHTGGLVPMYPETRGITSRWLRFLVHTYIDLRKELRDPLPEHIKSDHQLLDLHDAIIKIHFPENALDHDRAKKRFAFEELLFIQLRALRERARMKQASAPVIPLNVLLIKDFIKKLPFALTDAQRRALWEILQDIEKPQPMNRLLEGDVGSGKTVVACAVALPVVKAGFIVLFMAPTEILAVQHFNIIKKLLDPFGVEVGILTGSQKNVKHETAIVVGTHAIIAGHMQFGNLGLVVIDEQHRFGVEQRRAFVKKNAPENDKGLLPHFLSMSATPIPRTLALTIYGDLDLSIIDEMPQSRKRIITKIVEPGNRRDAYDFIKKEIERGRQVFVICPKIEPKKINDQKIMSPQTLLLKDLKNVKEECGRLKEKIFPEFRLAMLHGKMKPKEKNETMQRFKNREYDILVSTSVIEVGVDVPNATTMVIEGAERFGLAQMHQFRGRVGRGEYQSYCLLFLTEDGATTKRLRALVDAKNGFELAEKDLAIRGPGDLFGGRQSGIPDLALANITNTALVREVRDAAKKLVQQSPDLSAFPFLAAKLQRFEESIHFE